MHVELLDFIRDCEDLGLAMRQFLRAMCPTNASIAPAAVQLRDEADSVACEHLNRQPTTLLELSDGSGAAGACTFPPLVRLAPMATESRGIA